MRNSRWVSLSLVAAFTAFALGGCRVTGEDIEYWKRTVKGPGKIVAVLLSDRYEIELRAHAARALVEMEHPDVDGVELLQQGLDTLRSSEDPGSQEALQAIVAALVPDLERIMSGAEQTTGEQAGPPPEQVRAKDAAYLLIPYATGAPRTQLVHAVVGWYTTDFASRSLVGNFSAEQVVRSLGDEAAAVLVEAMNAHMPQSALVKITEIITQVGNEATKAKAAERIVAIEREMEGAEFVTWLKSQIRESLEGQGRGAEATDARITVIATLNRENFINDGVLPAMKFLGDQPLVAQRLVEIAAAAPPGNAPPELAGVLNERRKRALQALEGNAKEANLRTLLDVALDSHNPVDVRDYAFDRVGDIRSRAAIPSLWPLVERGTNEDLDKRLRWRAGELILAIGGNAVVGELLARLPSAEGVEYEPEELEGYATRMSTMTSPPTDAMRQQLRSPKWWNRVIALRFFERRGTQDDVARLTELTSDAAAVTGDKWGELSIDTVGKVAQAAISGLRERLTHPEQAQPSGS